MPERRPSPRLFQPFELRGVTTRNRITVSPMCQYSATNGIVGDYHLVHLGRFALGGAGIICVEATAVAAAGRISHADVGLYDDAQIAPLTRVTRFLKEWGAVPAVQLSHAGRKASGHTAWDGAGPLGTEDEARGSKPWPTMAPSAHPAEGWPMPREMSLNDIGANIEDWAAAARRAVAAGFEIIEVHGGHGYLVHQFLSPVSNLRTDDYGGSLRNRMRFALELTERLRAVIPGDCALIFRCSALDGSGGGWSMEDTVTLAAELKRRGVDAIDCSSGGMTAPTPTRVVPRGYGFQVPYAAAVKRGAGIPTMAVGLILEPGHAERILEDGDADLIAVGREALFDPNWPLHAELALSGGFDSWPLPVRGWLERRNATLASLDLEPPAVDLQSPRHGRRQG
jgi:2,4-dienoyl-CoA reductase-like NADH-dependent reductase (Old Yellow Enzyme family)